MKRFIAILMSVSLIACALPITGQAEAETDGLVYTFANDFVANADGVIQYTAGDITSEDVTSVTLYWGDENGNPLEDWTAIDETDAATIMAGYKMSGSKVIPWGAASLVARINFADETTRDIFVEIPDEKKNSGEEEYTMFYLSDSHINADEVNNTKADKASMITRFTELMTLMDELKSAGDNVIGVQLNGDIVVGVHTASTGHGLWEAYEEDYVATNEVLTASGIEDAYPIWYTNGNHDIIECENGDDSAFINFLDSKIELMNSKITDETYDANILSAIQPIEKESQKYWYDTYINGYHYIYLAVPYNGFGLYSDEQVTWLDELLAEDAKTGKITFIFGHYPLSYTHDDSAGHFDNSEVLEAVLDKYPNTVYISGHLHSNPETQRNMIIGDNATTLINTGAFLRADVPTVEYKSNGVYCKVYEDRIEFYGRVFYNFDNEEDPSGYWVSCTSNVLNLRNTTSSDMSAEIEADSTLLRNGTTLTATLNGADVDDTAYECKWYVGNTFAGTGATYTLSSYNEDGLAIQSGSVSVKITDKANTTKYAWAYCDTEAEVFKEISTAEELAKIGVDASYPLDGNYILMNDIDLSDMEWTPIGTMIHDSGNFTGTLEGNGHTISNLTISSLQPGNHGSIMYGGLFTHLEGATVRNLVMQGANITGGNSAYQVFIGAIAGNVDSSQDNGSTVIENVAIIDCNLSVSASSGACGVGAIAGCSDKINTSKTWSDGVYMSNCYSNSTLTNTKNNGQSCAGGFIGYVYNTKDQATSINNSIFNGTITGVSGKNNVGGIIARSAYDEAKTQPVLTNVYSNSDGYTSETITTHPYLDGTTLTTEQLIAANVSELSLGADKWLDSEVGPILKIVEHAILYPDYITISTAEELAKIGVDEAYPLDGKYILMNNIDLSGYENWDPIGSMIHGTDAFTGVLEGNGHMIRNLKVSATVIDEGASCIYGGLFAHTIGAEIRNLVMYNAVITGASSEKQVFLGVLAGDAEADIDGNPTIFTNVSVISSSVTVTAALNNVAGGGSFVGSVNKGFTTRRAGGAKFTDCYSNADIAVGLNGKQSTAGGFAGYVYGTKSPCEIAECIFDGTITGHAGKITRIGGFFGKAVLNDTVVTNAYSNSDKYVEKAAEESIYPVSGTMLTTEELATSSMTDLGLSENVWYITPCGAKHKLNMSVGDIDGNLIVDMSDVNYMRKYLVEAELRVNFDVADVTYDREINTKDLVRIRKDVEGVD